MCTIGQEEAWTLTITLDDVAWSPKAVVPVGRDWYVGLDPYAAKLNQVVCSAAGIQINGT